MIFNKETYLYTPNINMIDNYNYMWIDPIGKKIITAVSTPASKSTYSKSGCIRKGATVACYYKEVESGLIEVRAYNRSQSVLHHYKIIDETLWLQINDKKYGYRIINFDQVPEWANKWFEYGRARLADADSPGV
jgi:hypothetical protein